MKDKLEQYVADNRDELDVFEPRNGLWDNIHDKLHGERKVKRIKFMLAAASVLLAVTLCTWWINKPNESDVVVKTTPDTVQPIVKSPEVYYANVIATRRNELLSYCSSQPVLCSEFKKDLDSLDIKYNRLKELYQTSVNKDVILQAMINNMQMQLQVLSQQLYIIQNVQSNENKKQVAI
ncbi:MAG: hypothetical protein JST82_05320 [Bacteroidetes bacterium]|nr:hypothetical protein [Bacteroidota bacterium]